MPKAKTISEIGREDLDSADSITPDAEVVETAEETPEVTETTEDIENIETPDEEGGEPEGEPAEEVSEEVVQDENQTENFTNSFDPNNLADELKPVYKQLQADYTRKTQEISTIRKSLEAEKVNYDKVLRYVPLLNKVLANQELVQQVLGINPKTGDFKPPEEEIPTDPRAYAEWIKEKTLTSWREEQATREKIRGEQEALNREYQEAEKVDPRLNSDLAFQNVILGLVAINPDFKAGQINAVEATKQAIKFFDGKTKELVDIQTKKRREELFRKKNVIRDSDSGGNTIQTSDKPRSIRDAFKQAEGEGFKL
jgi:hypothetical protein